MTERDKAFQLSGDNFDYLCQFVYDTAGIVLNASKKEMVYRRLTRIIRERKLSSFTAYCNLLKADTEKEQDYFINAITTNLTSFFREQHHFDYMTQDELPKLLGNRLSHDKRLRIWSSASSTGEEPYSIAITVLEAMKSQLSQWDVKILATDIDSNVLAVAKEGTYDERRIEDVPRKFKEKYFTKGIGINESKVKVGKQLQALITFKKLNLLHEWPMKGPFDIIFCRNVIIYFDKKTQQELFARYYEMLAPGGLLILGHSENLGQYQQHFESVGRTIFRKAF
ncbi:protein-glutamate O-methyltransferase CheR [Colwellia sp. BRX8-4]|uniref:CheR family methyltransferase n=1 Tax=Colwellia sp. BRX8-4 TaxID=2759836 RepID=UPI0015F69520|nr:protein-glutamate O-methyltransferase CheR [Colwellia sp. BRX8-4]MBA6364262.1 protein-glutamate O-methyltransferase CheR [Colwellia sp. BRX8-8]MBA6372408.1 protein-glutamate O-methyltransferase CheR [Colwellia sp. BRX8-4]